MASKSQVRAGNQLLSQRHPSLTAVFVGGTTLNGGTLTLDGDFETPVPTLDALYVGPHAEVHAVAFEPALYAT